VAAGERVPRYSAIAFMAWSPWLRGLGRVGLEPQVRAEADFVCLDVTGLLPVTFVRGPRGTVEFVCEGYSLAGTGW